jgi:hypothetical protein
MILDVNGNLLQAKEQYIAQQCNCVTTSARGLAQDIANKFPWADVYRERSKYDVPGTISVKSAPDGDKHVICMFAQWGPSVCGRYASSYPQHDDTPTKRIQWFQQCVDAIDALQLKVVAVPYMIGCGMAGGKWEHYRKILMQAKTQFVVYHWKN